MTFRTRVLILTHGGAGETRSSGSVLMRLRGQKSLVIPRGVDETSSMQQMAADAAASHSQVRRIERFGSSLRRPDVSHVIFDFDGTLSWLRHGWPTIMRSWFLENGPAEWRQDAAVQRELLTEILSLNGKPSVFQARGFSERVQQATGRAPDPAALLEGYARRLREAIDGRRRSIADGAGREPFVIDGARALLAELRERGVRLVILSGTVENEVRDEARLLGLSEFFGEHIHGSTPDGAFSKKDVIDRIVREERIEGRHLLSFGDGPLEIEFTKAAGGLAIGVASDEDENGSHRSDAAKRDQLARAGADAIIPDYAEGVALLKEIFGR